ncbi:MAG: hypothetical protein ACLQT7_04210 [Candidatus Dormibacteria bacterium]
MAESIGGIPLRFFEEAARQLGKVVPPDAATHFLNAQREVVLGLTALLEARNQAPATPGRRRRAPAAAPRARRPRRVPVD